MKKYTVQYYIDKFEAIPEDEWCVGVLSNGKGEHCALGHCGATTGKLTDESNALVDLFANKLNTFAARVNDGRDERFQEESIKQRILTALRSIEE